MPRTSSGLLMFRRRDGRLQVLLVHPGGPFWKNKDEGAWSIPKGEVDDNEDLLLCARREFEEELGIAPQGSFIALSPIKQKAGKIVHAWCFEGDLDAGSIRSKMCSRPRTRMARARISAGISILCIAISSHPC